MTYRGLLYTVGPAVGDQRDWCVYPREGSKEGIARGMACSPGGRSQTGAFRAAVVAAQAAIDAYLDAQGPGGPVGG